MPQWEIARSVGSKVGLGRITIDRLWDRMSRAFDERVARDHLRGVQSVHAFEYTALETFRQAKRCGITCVLHLPSLDSKAYQEIESREKSLCPELASDDDGYFDKVFDGRYARRKAEIALADIVFVNSRLTMQSHVSAGADRSKFRISRLGAPSPIERLKNEGAGARGALRVMWAGSFSIRKGAHHFLDAWRLLAPNGRAEVDVFGEVRLPQRFLAIADDGINFRGSVSRAAVLEAFDGADVLVFPTLSDGFGMVVSESLSRGVPVVTTDQAGAADLIVHGQNGLIVPAADSVSLRDALRWCIENRDALHNMREAALESARSHQWSDFRQGVLRDLDAWRGPCAPSPQRVSS